MASGFLSPFVEREEGLVLELGSRVTRAGFSGEVEPRVELASPADLLSSSKTLEVFLKKLIRSLHVNLHECNVFVVEPFCCSYRELLAEVLFRRLSVRAVMFVSGPAAATLLTHPSYVLSVDVGASETRVLPLHEGSALLGAFVASPLGEEGDLGRKTVASLIAASVKKLPIDSRKHFSSNVLLLGGGSMQDGLRERLQQECEALGVPIQFCPRKSAAFTPTRIQWLGVAVVAASANLLTHDDGLITRAKYDELGMPDEWEIKA